MIRSGDGAKVVTQRLVITSLRSVMWSLWRWVSTSAVSWLACAPAAAARMRTPRPQSKSRVAPPARTSVAGPARRGSTSGLPVPSSVISIIPTFCHTSLSKCNAS